MPCLEINRNEQFYGTEETFDFGWKQSSDLSNLEDGMTIDVLHLEGTCGNGDFGNTRKESSYIL